MFPEYITSMEYYYGTDPRPGFMARFIVGNDGVFAPYWPTTNTSFGGLFGASNNGKFFYNFDPVEINNIIQIYDIKNVKRNEDEIGRIVHITFFTKEKTPDGKDLYELKKIILRGNKIVTFE